MESKAEYRFCWSSENCIVGVESREGWINQSQRSIPGLVVGWFFCFRLRQCSFHRGNVSDRVVNGIGRNGTAVFFRLRLRQACDSSYDSDSDFHQVISALTVPTGSRASVASENQPIKDCDTSFKATPDNNLHFLIVSSTTYEQFKY